MSDPLVVTTREGRVAGSWASPRVRRWSGIPYAAAPVGDRRFAPPEPHAPWVGTRPALSSDAVCPQPPMTGATTPGTMTEDCLVLNVWSPDGARDLPVVVWIHGGGYLWGTANTPVMDGTGLADRGPVVVVSLNYRLGHRGFLDLSTTSWAGLVPTNLGLRDQVRALEWVRDNIEAFGGDPGTVTIAGQSAGGGSVACLVASPAARGLFSRAIAQSPPAASVHSPERAATMAEAFLEILHRQRGRTPDLLDDDEPSRLAAAALLLLDEGIRLLPGHHAFQPVIDGDVLLDTPAESVRRRLGSRVPLLVGSNADESSLFALPGMPPLVPTGPAALRQLLRQDHPARQRRLEAAYGGLEQPAACLDLGADAMVTVPALALAEATVAAGSPAHVYRFCWTNDDLRDRGLGTPHTLDLPFVLGTLDTFRFSDLTSPVPAGMPSAEQLSHRMQQAWLAFVASGDPSTTHDAWPVYDPATRRVLPLGGEGAVGAALDEARLAAWLD